jgi:HlyD family secretion protein
MRFLFTRISFWAGLAGLFVMFQFLRANNSSAPMPEPLSEPPAKPFVKGMGAAGIVEASQENTNIGVPLAALVTEVSVKVWQKVKKGDVLLKLDDRELRVQLISLQADLKVREAELHKAERQYQRLAKIGVGAALSREDLETSEDNLTVARAMLEKARSQIIEMETKLQRFTVSSALDGTVLQVNTRPGEFLTPGASASPVVIGDIDQLQVRVDVDEQLAGRVREGTTAVAYRKGQSGTPIQLEFVRIEPYIIPKRSLTGSSLERVDTRVLPVIFRFPNTPGQKTYVGQQMDVFIEE